MDPRGGNVRLTEEAHGLLAEMSDDYDSSMKDVASEAVIRMSQRKRDDRRYRFGAFALGAVSCGALMFVVGLAI